MLITLSGVITHKSKDWIIVETSGVGYQVFVTNTLLSELRVDKQIRLWVHEQVREDGHDLFGFETYGELDMFGRLVAISGVGPRTALGVMSIGPVSEIERAVEHGDVDLLSRVPRVGRKTAQKIVIELKGKLTDLGATDADSDAIDALVAMGYNREAARDALKSAEGGSVEGRLKSALKSMGRKR